MIQSMTGFGKSVRNLGDKKITCEIRSLNSKQTDISTKLPQAYREKDMVIRSLVAKALKRGKIDIAVYTETSGVDSSYTLNEALFRSYFQKFKSLEEELGAEGNTDLFAVISRLPDVMKPQKEELDADEWEAVSGAVEEATNAIVEFRKTEGAKLEEDLTLRVKNISELQKHVEPLEKERMDKVRTRLEDNIREQLSNTDVNKDRLEQEIIYYLEKLDISEEKTRLKAHCELFLHTLQEEHAQGKKLGFIAQEMGREINTMGAKANHAEIQRIVVQMKDELEKIKEQVLNVL